MLLVINFKLFTSSLFNFVQPQSSRNKFIYFRCFSLVECNFKLMFLRLSYEYYIYNIYTHPSPFFLSPTPLSPYFLSNSCLLLLLSLLYIVLHILLDKKLWSPFCVALMCMCLRITAPPKSGFLLQNTVF